MTHLSKLLLNSRASIRKALKAIEAGGVQLAIVVDTQGRLLGTVSDGDIREALLLNLSMNEPIENFMNKNPTVAQLGTPREDILSLMINRSLRQIPIVDKDGIVRGLELVEKLLSFPKRSNQVVLMVGGLGSRLRPLTNETPKPLIPVRGRPILEWIIEGLIQYGFHKFTLAVNYKSEMIQEYFGDGSKWEIEVDYLIEDKKLGTAGALSILKEKPTEPFLVMNGDLITKVNFSQLMDFHSTNQAMATMCIQNHLVEIPYGVVQTKGLEIVSIVEKPSHEVFVNSGIYVFSPKVLEYLEFNQPLDIPEIFQMLIKNKQAAYAFPINSFWMDIACRRDLKKARLKATHLEPSMEPRKKALG